MQRGAFHARHEFHDACRTHIHDEAVDDLVAQVAVRHLAATETQAGLHLVAIVQEADSLVLLRLVVVLIHGNGELNFLDDDNLLLLARSAVALVLLVEILAVILDAADGGNGVWGDFHEIQRTFARDLQRVERGHDAKLFAIFIDHADFARADFFVGADETLDGTLVSKRWNSSPPQRTSYVSLHNSVYNVAPQVKRILCAINH